MITRNARVILIAAAVLAVPANAADWTSNQTEVSTFRSHYYIYDPKDDITAPELAKVLGAILPALACRNVIGNGCDPTAAIEALPPNARRHFVLHGEVKP